MRIGLILGTTALAGAAGLLMTVPSSAEEEIDAGALFRERCATCHTVPDRTMATDRAWLDQVKRTA